MKNNKGITLIALVVTIIILLILAGISIAMLTGDNGILTNATKTSTENAYYSAEEQVKLAYMAVRTEIMAQVVKDGTYDARLNDSDENKENVKSLAQIVFDDVAKNNSKFEVHYKGATVSTQSSSRVGEIYIKYTDSAIDQFVIEDNKTPKHEGYVVYKITLNDQGADLDTDIDSLPASGLTKVQ